MSPSDLLPGVIAVVEAEYARLVQAADILHQTLASLKGVVAAPPPSVPAVTPHRLPDESRRPRTSQTPGKRTQRAALQAITRQRPALVIAREQAILTHLAKGPSTCAAVVAAVPAQPGMNAEQHQKAIGNALFRMKTRQQIAQDKDGLYRAR